MKTICQTILTTTHFLTATLGRVGKDHVANVSFVCPTCGTRRDFNWVNRIPCHVPPEGTRCGAEIELEDGTCPKCKETDALHKVRHPGTFATPECWSFICHNCDYETDPQ